MTQSYKRKGKAMRTLSTGESEESRVSRERLRLLWSATSVAVVLHSAEEWSTDMTGWISRRPWLPAAEMHEGNQEFTLVLALVTAALLALAALAVVARPRWSSDVLVCVLWALMANAAGHAVLSLLSWSVMPGTISGVAVIMPLGVLALRALPPVRWTVGTTVTTLVAALGLMAGAFALAALLHGIG
jgi:hypothetical protein